jgi:DNA mismatch repair ATPase MutL
MKKLFVGQVGTTVSLHNLFHSLPVRYKEFQRNIKKVYNSLSSLVPNDSTHEVSGKILM